MGADRSVPFLRRRSVKITAAVVAGTGATMGLASLLPSRPLLGDGVDDDVAKPYLAVAAHYAAAVHEKRRPDAAAWAEGVAANGRGEARGGQWRARSEPGEVYMGGGADLEPRRLGAFSGDARAAGFYSTPGGDSVAAEALVPNCTAYGIVPLSHYPAHYPIADVLANWPPDAVAVPPRHYASLCRFDHSDAVQRRSATASRAAPKGGGLQDTSASRTSRSYASTEACAL